MKYLITCDHCGTRFIVEAPEGQTVECKCPGCKGTMQVSLPKKKKQRQDKTEDEVADAPGLQIGEAIPQNDGESYGRESSHRRPLIIGCLLGVVLTAAAVTAFLALHRTANKPVEDPYQYVTPDTAEVEETVPDSEETAPDTIQLHEEVREEEPAVVADSALTVPNEEEETPQEETSPATSEEKSAEHSAEPSVKSGTTSKEKTQAEGAAEKPKNKKETPI